MTLTEICEKPFRKRKKIGGVRVLFAMLWVLPAAFSGGCGGPDATPGTAAGRQVIRPRDLPKGMTLKDWLKSSNRLPNARDYSPPPPPPLKLSTINPVASVRSFFPPDKKITAGRIIEGLGSKNLYVRFQACRLAGFRREKACIPRLSKMLTPGFPAGPAAAWALGEISGRQPEKALRNALDKLNGAKRSDIALQAAVINALGRCKDRKAVSLLLEAQASTLSPRVQAAACHALYEIGADRSRVMKAMRKITGDDTLPTAVRLEAARVLTLKEGGREEAEAVFREAWNSSSADNRVVALEAALSAFHSDAISWLVSGLADPSPEVWGAAVNLCAATDDDRIEPALLRVIDLRPEPMSTRAVLALAMRGCNAAPARLLKIIESGSPRTETIFALKGALALGMTEYYPQIEDLLESIDPEIRVAAAWTLAYMNIGEARERILEASRFGSNYARAEILAACRYLDARHSSSEAGSLSTPPRAIGDDGEKRSAGESPGTNLPRGKSGRFSPAEIYAEKLAAAEVLDIAQSGGRRRGAVLRLPGREPVLVMVGETVSGGYTLSEIVPHSVVEFFGGKNGDNQGGTVWTLHFIGPGGDVYLAPGGYSKIVPPDKR